MVNGEWRKKIRSPMHHSPYTTTINSVEATSAGLAAVAAPVFSISHLSFTLRDEDEFTELRAIFHQLVRAAGFRKRQSLIDDGADRSALDELHGVEQLGL